MPSLESILQEHRVFAANSDFQQQARVPHLDAYQALREQAEQHPEEFWAQLARQHLAWRVPFTEVLDSSQAPFYRWFADGRLNASYNCLDRHLPQRAQQIAIIFESDSGEITKVTYQALYERVSQFANGLLKLGLQMGDRVVLYMPMSVEAVIAMQACARLGLVHSVVFAGFSARSLHERIVDVGARCIITANEGLRAGKRIPIKHTVEEALDLGGCEMVEHVVVYQRTADPCTHWHTKRDIWWHDLERDQPLHCEPRWVPAEHPLFVLYTSGSTGKPKGLQHSTAGYLLGTITSMQWVFDWREGDVFWCTADVGWITGHSYVAYGPLACGATQLIYEGVPTYPDAHRAWQMIERHQVSVFYTAPTAIRTLIKQGADFPRQHDLSSLRLLGSVGEPINPEAWMWYYQEVGQSRCPIVDTWWQTETGSHMLAPIPGAVAQKPGSCTLPLPGIAADVVDEEGASVPLGQGGHLVIRRPVPSLARTIWGDPERYRNGYFPEYLGGKTYLAGDAAYRDADGYYWILGRIDDVINVSGHRLGTMEIESALVAHPLVAEAAVVGRPHDIKGEAVVAFVVLKGERPKTETEIKIAKELKEWVAHEIGALARPEEIRLGDNLPKTRSGKIMRRLLRALAQGQTVVQDTSTLENPGILDQLSLPGH